MYVRSLVGKLFRLKLQLIWYIHLSIEDVSSYETQRGYCISMAYIISVHFSIRFRLFRRRRGFRLLGTIFPIEDFFIWIWTLRVLALQQPSWRRPDTVWCCLARAWDLRRVPKIKSAEQFNSSGNTCEGLNRSGKLLLKRDKTVPW
jgi:hypothetical protein